MTESILPPNASGAERAIEAAILRAGSVPTPLRSVKRPAVCPPAFLPWLAWEWSVDGWNNDWTVEQRRAAIAAAYGVHKIKGTVGAIKRALSAIGYRTRVVEWFENGGAPYTFDVEIEVEDRGITDAVYRDAETVANATKNARSHLVTVRAIARTTGRAYIGVATTVGEVVSVMPYSIEAIVARARATVSVGTTSSESAAIYPRQ